MKELGSLYNGILLITFGLVFLIKYKKFIKISIEVQNKVDNVLGYNSKADDKKYIFQKLFFIIFGIAMLILGLKEIILVIYNN